MTYTPIKTIVQSGTNLTESIDLTQTLQSFHSETAYLVVQNSYSTDYVISLNQIMLFTSGLDMTQPVSTALSSLLTDQFVTRYNSPEIPVIGTSGYYKNRIRVMNPISWKDTSVSFGSVNTPGVVDQPNQRGSLDDLVISTTTENLNNALVAVDGVFHKTTLFDNQIYVLDGFRTMRLCGRKDMTLIDTTNVGGHTVLPLTTDNVSHTAYNGLAVITTPTSIAGKTVCIVIDGYFYHLDTEVLLSIDNTHVGIRTNLIDFITQFRHNPRTVYQPDRYGLSVSQSSLKYTDTYATAFLGNNSVPSATFKTLAFQLSRLTAFHSFLVIFNRPNIFTVSRDLFTMDTPRFYYDYTNLPLDGMANYGCGLCPSFLIHKEAAFRKQIFVSDVDINTDYQNTNPSPLFIPAITNDSDLTENTHLSFTDYIST